jgi:hypothetical protein
MVARSGVGADEHKMERSAHAGILTNSHLRFNVKTTLWRNFVAKGDAMTFGA